MAYRSNALCFHEYDPAALNRASRAFGGFCTMCGRRKDCLGRAVYITLGASGERNGACEHFVDRHDHIPFHRDPVQECDNFRF